MIKYIIVTNTYHRPADLVERSLRASLNQKHSPVKVILIDQNETLLNLSGDITSNPLFERQKADKKSVSAARNSLIIPGEAEWIFFCDDDGYPHENYSERLMKIISENDFEILAGSIVREDTGGYYSLRHKKGGSLKYFRNTKNLMGSNFAVKVKTFNELNRFDENFGVASYWGSSEETDFCWKAFFTGKKMEYFPGLVVYHVPPFNETRAGIKKAFYYGIGKGALVGKWLFVKKESKVFYEFFEMIIVPVIQSVRGLVTLNLFLVGSNMAALAGRVYGLIRFIFVRKYSP